MSPALINGHGGSGTFSSGQRRGPIAAEFQGPGPASVSLPSTIGTNKFVHHHLCLFNVPLLKKKHGLLVGDKEPRGVPGGCQSTLQTLGGKGLAQTAREVHGPGRKQRSNNQAATCPPQCVPATVDTAQTTSSAVGWALRVGH